MTSPTDIQARIFTRYLIKKDPTETHTQLFSLVVAGMPDADHERTLQLALTYHWLLPYLDAYDALFNPNSQLRKRLYVMFSILEATPDFTDMFLPQKRAKTYVIFILAHGMRSVFRLLVGVIIMKLGVS